MMNMRKILSTLLILLLALSPVVEATTSIARAKTWTAEKLYAADLNVEFDNIINYLNNNIAWVTNITASATDINQTDNNRFIQASTFIAAITDSASETMNTGFTYTNHGKAVFDSAEVDTFYSNSNGTRADNSFFFLPLTDNVVYFGTPTKRLRSITVDSLIATYTSAGTADLDSSNIKTGGVSSTNLRNLSVDSTKIYVGSISNTNLRALAVDSNKVQPASIAGSNLRNDAVDSTKIRAGSVAGSDLASTLGGVRLTLPQGLTVNDSLVVAAGNFRAGTNNLTVNGTRTALGATAALSKLHIQTTAAEDAANLGPLSIRNSAGTKHLDVVVLADTSGLAWRFYSANILQSVIGTAGATYFNGNGNQQGFIVGKTTAFNGEQFTIQGINDGTAVVINVPAVQANVTGADTFVVFRSNSGPEAAVVGTGVPGVIAYTTFTGAHDALLADENEVIEIGMLVSASGGVIPQITSYLPTIRKSNGRTDKAVYGVYAGHGSKTSTPDKAKKFTCQVLAIGSGIIYVTDSGGDIENGDFISPSPTKGYGERQTIGFDGVTPDPQCQNITIAKAVVSISWDSVAVDPVAGIKRRVIPCVFK